MTVDAKILLSLRRQQPPPLLRLQQQLRLMMRNQDVANADYYYCSPILMRELAVETGRKEV